MHATSLESSVSERFLSDWAVRMPFGLTKLDRLVAEGYINLRLVPTLREDC